MVLTYWSFPDALIQAYTLPYLKIIKSLETIDNVYFVTLDKVKLNADHSQQVELLSKNGIKNISFTYHPFGFKAAFTWLQYIFYLLKTIRKEKIDVIHCWCTPAGAIGYILSVLTGKKLVLDSYEPHAEAMVENGSWRKNSIAFKILFLLEKLQTKRAIHHIAASSGMRSYAKEKYNTHLKSFHVKPACVDLDLFNKEEISTQTTIYNLGLENKIICVYAGKFGGIYYEKEVFDFFKVAFDYWGEQFKVVLLSNLSDNDLHKLCNCASLPTTIISKYFVPHSEVPKFLALGSFGITPVKSVPTKRYCTPIKDGEYWALGLPVIITPNISDDTQIISENGIGAIMDVNNPKTYLSAIQTIEKLISSDNLPQLHDKIRNVAKKYRSFSVAEKVYQQIYSN